MDVMRIKYGEPFRIPRRLGDLFRDVVRIDGVEYVRGKGFIVRDYYAMVNLNKILMRMGLTLAPTVNCVMCGASIECDKCEYTDVCRKEVTLCICGNCAYSPNSFERYRDVAKSIYLNRRL